MEDNDTAMAVNQPSHMLQIIDRVVQSGLTAESVGVLEKMLNMQERIMADQRKTAFMAAMSRLQAKLPQISKEGRVVVKGVERSRFARLEDIDVAIKPLLAEEGFAFSFDEDSSDGKSYVLSAKLSHRDGHSETKRITLPLDSSDYRTPVQSRGSTQSYAMRYLIKMHLSIVEQGSDTDGNPIEKITDEEAKDIETAITDTKASLPLFLKHFGIASVKELLKRDHAAAVEMLNAKRRNMK